MPRLKPPPSLTVAHEDHAPPTEDIEIVLGEETPDAPTEIELVAPPAPVPAPTPEPEDNPLQKALEAQQRAEELQRTAQRERDDALRREREREQELHRERGDREDAQYNSVLTAIAAEQSAVAKAEQDYAAAASAGDWTTAAAAQRIMASASARLDRLEDGKQAFDAKRDVTRTAPEPRQPAAQPQEFEQRIAALPDNAKTWLRNHPEFMNDTSMNRKIQAAHSSITELDGVAAFSTAYFDALDTRFGFKAAPQPEPAAQPPPKQRSLPMSAPVSRDVPSASGQRQPSSKVTLSAEERQIARTSFTASDMTNEQKEYLYAQNKKKLNAMKANGTYSERRE